MISNYFVLYQNKYSSYHIFIFLPMGQFSPRVLDLRTFKFHTLNLFCFYIELFLSNIKLNFPLITSIQSITCPTNIHSNFITKYSISYQNKYSIYHIFIFLFIGQFSPIYEIIFVLYQI